MNFLLAVSICVCVKSVKLNVVTYRNQGILLTKTVPN